MFSVAKTLSNKIPLPMFKKVVIIKVNYFLILPLYLKMVCLQHGLTRLWVSICLEKLRNRVKEAAL